MDLNWPTTVFLSVFLLSSTVMVVAYLRYHERTIRTLKRNNDWHHQTHEWRINYPAKGTDIFPEASTGDDDRPTPMFMDEERP